MATESDKVNVGAITTLVAVGAIAMVVIVGLLTALVRQELAADQERKGGAVNTRPYRDTKAAQLAELTEEAKWIDKAKGVLSIPIDRAMSLVVEDIARDPALATPTLPSAAASAAAPDASGAPAASASAAPSASIAPNGAPPSASASAPASAVAASPGTAGSAQP
jgi:hypothetical protein